MTIRSVRALWWIAAGLSLAALSACGAATRATIHADDLKKVFPWPSGQASVSIRAKPQTTMANTCVWFGSYQTVEVTGATTFYLTDEVGQAFAYTPARSPIRRLAPIKKIEIRWPLTGPAVPGAPHGTGPAVPGAPHGAQPGTDPAAPPPPTSP